MSHRGRCDADVESFLVVGGLLWLALASLRWLLQRPKLWPVAALLLYAGAHSGPEVRTREEMTAGEPFHTLHACSRALGRWIPIDSLQERGPDVVRVRLVGVPRRGLITWCGSTDGVFDRPDTSFDVNSDTSAR